MSNDDYNSVYDVLLEELRKAIIIKDYKEIRKCLIRLSQYNSLKEKQESGYY